MDLGSARAGLSSLADLGAAGEATAVPLAHARAPTIAAAFPGTPFTSPVRPAPEAGCLAEAQLLLFVGEAIRPDAALAALLAREGLRCLCLPGAEQAQRAAALARFDAVLIDGALVDGRAVRAIEALAATHQCPVVVLGEQADEVDEILALELGADLYLARPLAPRRLRAHLSALLRRRRQVSSGAGAGATAAAQTAGWTLQPAQQQLRRGARTVRLTPAQTALLACLMQAAGSAVPAPTLLAALPQAERLHARSLRVHVHRLRQRLLEEGVHELQLESVRGSGYRLEVPLQEAA